MSEIFSKILKDKNGKVLNVGSKYKQPEWGAEEVVLLPETELAFAMNDDLGMDCAFVELSQALAADTSYTINFNGVVYNCKSIAADDGSIIVGNATALGGTGNDEPFMLLETGGMNIVVPLDGSTSATMSIAECTIHKIHAPYTVAETMCVHVTAPLDGTITADKTYAEILEAVDAGVFVFLDVIGSNSAGAETRNICQVASIAKDVVAFYGALNKVEIFFTESGNITSI